jgi:hypothetical protein
LPSAAQAVGQESSRKARLLLNHLADPQDLIARTYGSADFREVAQAFTEKRPPVWCGP